MIELLRGQPLLSRDVIVDLVSSSSRASAAPEVDSPRIDAMAWPTHLAAGRVRATGFFHADFARFGACIASD